MRKKLFWLPAAALMGALLLTGVSAEEFFTEESGTAAEDSATFEEDFFAEDEEAAAAQPEETAAEAEADDRGIGLISLPGFDDAVLDFTQTGEKSFRISFGKDGDKTINKMLAANGWSFIVKIGEETSGKKTSFPVTFKDLVANSIYNTVAIKLVRNSKKSAAIPEEYSGYMQVATANEDGMLKLAVQKWFKPSISIVRSTDDNTVLVVAKKLEGEAYKHDLFSYKGFLGYEMEIRYIGKDGKEEDRTYRYFDVEDNEDVDTDYSKNFLSIRLTEKEDTTIKVRIRAVVDTSAEDPAEFTGEENPNAYFGQWSAVKSVTFVPVWKKAPVISGAVPTLTNKLVVSWKGYGTPGSDLYYRITIPNSANPDAPYYSELLPSMDVMTSEEGFYTYIVSLPDEALDKDLPVTVTPVFEGEDGSTSKKVSFSAVKDEWKTLDFKVTAKQNDKQNTATVTWKMPKKKSLYDITYKIEAVDGSEEETADAYETSVLMNTENVTGTVTYRVTLVCDGEEGASAVSKEITLKQNWDVTPEIKSAKHIANKNEDGVYKIAVTMDKKNKSYVYGTGYLFFDNGKEIEIVSRKSNVFTVLVEGEGTHSITAVPVSGDTVGTHESKPKTVTISQKWNVKPVITKVIPWHTKEAKVTISFTHDYRSSYRIENRTKIVTNYEDVHTSLDKSTGLETVTLTIPCRYDAGDNRASYRIFVQAIGPNGEEGKYSAMVTGNCKNDWKTTKLTVAVAQNKSEENRGFWVIIRNPIAGISKYRFRVFNASNDKEITSFYQIIDTTVPGENDCFATIRQWEGYVRGDADLTDPGTYYLKVSPCFEDPDTGKMTYGKTTKTKTVVIR